MRNTIILVLVLFFAFSCGVGTSFAQGKMFYAVFVDYDKTVEPTTLKFSTSPNIHTSVYVDDICISGTGKAPKVYYASVLDGDGNTISGLERVILGDIQSILIIEYPEGAEEEVPEDVMFPPKGSVRLCIPYAENGETIEIRGIADEHLFLSVDVSAFATDDEQSDSVAVGGNSGDGDGGTLLGIAFIVAGVLLATLLIFLATKKRRPQNVEA